jgi:uncharacterized protein YbjQ (UPF0145 family)
MILTTTNTIEDYKIIEYKGIVSGVAVNIETMKLTFNMQKYYAGVSDSIVKIKEQALEQLRTNAEKLNANAVIGITIDLEVKSNDHTIVVSTNGTAVNIVKK